MKYYCSVSKKPRLVAESFLLVPDAWNDFGHVCLFHLHFVDEKRVRHTIGPVKILRAKKGGLPDDGTVRTKLPSSFESLSGGDISLGQNEKYYSNLTAALGRSGARSALQGLNDIAYYPNLALAWEPTSAFRNAVVRENQAERARRIGGAIVRGESISKSFSFSYESAIPGASATVELAFNFDQTDELPHRIVALIGRNAVGKTRILANLASDLVQLREQRVDRSKEREGRFGGARPLFSRVIAVSYSAFDHFARPRHGGISYVYCGIRNEKGVPTRSHLNSTLLSNMQRITESGRRRHWDDAIHQVFGEAAELVRRAVRAQERSAEFEADLALSSGQAILLHFVSSLVAWIQPGSLVLFDEPETHLHPNAVAGVFNALARILDRFDSFAVLGTHSPILIQDVPASRVIVLRRTDNSTVATPLQAESFGENISELTRHVFETHEVRSFYKGVLDTLLESHDVGEVESLFERGLSLNAKAYLLGRSARLKAGK